MTPMGDEELAPFPLFCTYVHEKMQSSFLAPRFHIREAVVDAVAIAAAEASTVALSRSQEGPSLFLCLLIVVTRHP